MLSAPTVGDITDIAIEIPTAGLNNEEHNGSVSAVQGEDSMFDDAELATNEDRALVSSAPNDQPCRVQMDSAAMRENGATPVAADGPSTIQIYSAANSPTAVDLPESAPDGYIETTANPLADTQVDSAHNYVSSAAPRLLQVQVPDGAGPGSHLRVRVPSGQIVTIRVPAGASTGTLIRTPLPAAMVVDDPSNATTGSAIPEFSNDAPDGPIPPASNSDGGIAGVMTDNDEVASQGSANTVDVARFAPVQSNQWQQHVGMVLALAGMVLTFIALRIFVDWDTDDVTESCSNSGDLPWQAKPEWQHTLAVAEAGEICLMQEVCRGSDCPAPVGCWKTESCWMNERDLTSIDHVELNRLATTHIDNRERQYETYCKALCCEHDFCTACELTTGKVEQPICRLLGDLMRSDGTVGRQPEIFEDSYRCAMQQENCYCGGRVKFGKGSTWSKWVHVDEGSIACTSAVFGDPFGGQIHGDLDMECVCENTFEPKQLPPNASGKKGTRSRQVGYVKDTVDVSNHCDCSDLQFCKSQPAEAVQAEFGTCCALYSTAALQCCEDLEDWGWAWFYACLAIALIASPIILGIKKCMEVCGSSCLCCLDCFQFTGVKQPVFYRIVIPTVVCVWLLLLLLRDPDSEFFKALLVVGGILNAIFCAGAVYLDRRGSRRQATIAAQNGSAAGAGSQLNATPVTSSIPAAPAETASATTPPAVNSSTLGTPRASAASQARSLLRCGSCQTIFGLPPATPPEAAARCPHCSAINRQPPTFAVKHSRLQTRLRDQRVYLQRQRRQSQASKLRVAVNRSRVLETSFSQMRTIPGHVLRTRPLSIRFEGEEALDHGGVTREWIELLSAELLNPQLALFESAGTNDYSYMVNPLSSINAEHLGYFAFLGRVLAKCICDGVTVSAHFTPDVYSCLLQVPVKFADLQLIDSEVYRSLEWMLENDVDDLGMAFVVDVDHFGEIIQEELKADGKSCKVTNTNKEEFVNLKARHIMVSRRKDQLDAIKHGFNSVLPLKEIAAFDTSELELLLCGVPRLDIHEWRQHTVYRSGYSESHAAIQMFWGIIEAWNDDYRAKLLRFVTGTSAIPPGGFASLQGSEGLQSFCVIRVRWGDERLPQASTCFNQLMLPAYADAGIMRDKLELAITETVGFGLR